jgi:PAS domain S-box-containing protein
MLSIEKGSVKRSLIQFGVPICAVAGGVLLRLIITDDFGPGLPAYITFYPAIMLSAIAAGFLSGLVATAISILIAIHWILPPIGEFAIAGHLDAVAAVLFSAMGVFMSGVAEFYRRNRQKVAAYDKEKALRDSEKRLRRFYESGVLGVTYWNMNGEITDANARFLEMVGYDREDLAAGQINWGRMTPPEYRHLDEDSVAELKATGVNKKPFEKEYIRKDGTRIPIIVASAMLDETRFNGVAFVLDLTDRKRMEEELRRSRDDLEIMVQERTADLARANQELQEEMAQRQKAEKQLRQAQKMEAIGTLTGGIAHDFNNILGAIVINSEMALLDLPGGSDVRANLDLILKSGLRGKDLVEQMLLFSRKSEKKQEVLTLTPLIKETFKLLRSTLPTTIQIKLHLETESDGVYADPSQIQQVIMNLCMNAAYAMHGTTGSIDVSLQWITFGSTDLPEADMQPGDYLVLSVKDTGSGMDEEVKKRIFEPFFTTKPVGEGTGLGLSVVYGIVKNHKGNITVYSDPGRGSIFKVYLPKVDTGASAAPETPKPVPRGNERILLVDDEESNIKTLQNMLQHLGYKIIALMESREALKVFSADPSQFDLLITDQTMPFLTGEDLGKEVMRMRPDIPVILCTGYSDLISSEKAEALGFRGYIMKPFTVREGAELVRCVLDQK